MQMPDLELRFQIHFVIVFCPQPVARLSTILAHHNDRRLHGSQTRKNQVEQNEWIGIERLCCENNTVHRDPDKQHCSKGDQKFPAATELGDAVGESLPKREFPFELFTDVARKNLMEKETKKSFTVEEVSRTIDTLARRRISDLWINIPVSAVRAPCL